MRNVVYLSKPAGTGIASRYGKLLKLSKGA